jgi:hypothetical protein
VLELVFVVVGFIGLGYLCDRDDHTLDDKIKALEVRVAQLENNQPAAKR